jgi:hypothetical protein
MIIEERKARIIFNRVGGNAGKNSLNTKISLPKSWVDNLELTPNNREIILRKITDRIVLLKSKDNQEFIPIALTQSGIIFHQKHPNTFENKRVCVSCDILHGGELDLTKDYTLEEIEPYIIGVKTGSTRL